MGLPYPLVCARAGGGGWTELGVITELTDVHTNWDWEQARLVQAPMGKLESQVWEWARP